MRSHFHGPCREPLGISLTLLQANTVLQWDRLHRARGVRAAIALNHAAADEVVEVAVTPRCDPSWFILRRPDGRFLMLDVPHDETRDFPSLQSAFRYIGGVLDQDSAT